jgi:kumamolisin
MTPREQIALFQGNILPAYLLQRPAGAADPDQILRVTLRLLPKGGDAAVFARVAQLGQQAPTLRQHGGARSLADEFGPAGDALAAVRAFCAEHGFILDRLALGGLFATIVGKAGDLARAFGAELGMYHYEDRLFRGYPGALRLPAALLPHVVAVLGLDDTSSLLPQATKPDPCVGLLDTMSSNRPTTVTASYYQYPTQFTGAGSTVAFMESSLALDMTNIQAFFTGLVGKEVQVEVIRGMANVQPPDGTAAKGPAPIQPPEKPAINGEAMMDIKLTGSVAPDATLVVYGQNQNYGYSSDGWIDALLAALDKPEYPCHVMSISLGMPESIWAPDVMQAVHFLFGVACLQGVTVCVSSGDFGAAGNGSGAYEQNCAFPATSPFCLACGGTELLIADDLQLKGEVVWNEMAQVHQKCATGGGISMKFPVPNFQQDLSMPAPFNPQQAPGRGIPDVAANAALSSGYALVPGNTGDFYGTSAAAPIWAALFALLVEGNDGKALGYLNPWLYAAQIDINAGCCRPITQGNNGAPGSTIAYSAESGTPWNACCGLGSPLGLNFAAALGIDVSARAG